ncbi:MAG: TonB C-terminal domain-containing protein [Longimicrobiales bacterium]|nr:TonB C-terminal domain-containing protein [Longimicrobiales bacterium]
MRWTRFDARRSPPWGALAGSVLVHGVVGALLVLLSLARPEPLEFVSYRIEIVSPPPPRAEEVAEAAPVEELEIETPDDPVPEPETPPPPDPEPEPEPEPEPVEEPAREETPPETPPADSVPPTEAATTEEVEETVEGGEDINVRMEGLQRDYPEYYGNIVRQIRRCWRPPQDTREGLAATIYFVIRADGTVTEARLVERSGVARFDYGALDAIGGCASGRFGPLPADLGYDRLPIQFEFRPAGGTPAAPPSTPDDA